MSVYTTVTPAELEAWLARYALGDVELFEPIAAGIENTNYFVTTNAGAFVLTLYERLPADELPFYLNLMAHLARAGVECPAPMPDRTGALFSLLNGKPAGLVSRLSGMPVETPDVAHCAAVGGALGRLHVASTTYRARLTNRRGPAWWRAAARAVRPFLDHEQNALIASELRFQTGFREGKMPRGAIHGDLFCDNVLFEVDRVTGIIDFGFAATDFLAYDLAITVNDWCVVSEGPDAGELVPTLVEALVSAYDAVRPLGEEERLQWPALLRAAALRFWLSRLYDLYLPRPGELVHAHDPSHFERILRHRVSNPPRWPVADRSRFAGASAT
jgi:homoserine kinase type II